jgi:predicted site-specific integrase-resolvase
MARKLDVRGVAVAADDTDAEFPLTSHDAIRVLECSLGHLHNLTSQGKLPHHKKRNGRLRFREADLWAHVANHQPSKVLAHA